MTVIGFAGTRGSGKDTAASMVEELLEPNNDHALGPEHPLITYRLSFARPLKEFVQAVFDMTDDQVWGDKKEELDLRYPRDEAIQWLKGKQRAILERFCKRYGLVVSPGEMDFFLAEMAADGAFGPAVLTPRHAQQTLGTEWGRAMYPKVWTNLLRTQVRKFQERVPDAVILVTDVRFPNEVEAVRAEGGVIWRINRRGRRPEAHDSERLVAGLQVDLEIQNDGTLEQLREKLARHLTDMLEVDPFDTQTPQPMTRLDTDDIVQNED